MGEQLPDEVVSGEAWGPGGAESAGSDLGSAVGGEIGRRFKLNGVRGEVGDVAASQAIGGIVTGNAKGMEIDGWVGVVGKDANGLRHEVQAQRAVRKRKLVERVIAQGVKWNACTEPKSGYPRSYLIESRHDNPHKTIPVAIRRDKPRRMDPDKHRRRRTRRIRFQRASCESRKFGIETSNETDRPSSIDGRQNDCGYRACDGLFLGYRRFHSSWLVDP